MKSKYSVRRIVSGLVVAGLVLAARLAAADTVTVPVQVTFVDPVTITEVSALTFGSLDKNLTDLERVTIAPDNTVADPAGRVEGGTQAAASMTIKASPGQRITIQVDAVDPGAGYSLSDFRCSYNAGSDTPCEGAGFSETTAAAGTLFVGATLTADGTTAAGPADGSLDVTVVYQ